MLKFKTDKIAYGERIWRAGDEAFLNNIFITGQLALVHQPTGLIYVADAEEVYYSER